jgi:hypothetical protein
MIILIVCVCLCALACIVTGVCGYCKAQKRASEQAEVLAMNTGIMTSEST